MSTTLQTDLVMLGYGDIVGKIDGIVGTKTKKAVRQLQINQGLIVDGIAGKQTKGEIASLKRQAGKVGTRNFNIHEFQSPDTKTLPPGGMDADLLLKLEMLRWKLGNHSVIINSGYRTKDFNARIGGYKYSNHLTGKAADIVVKNVSAGKVHQAALTIFEGVGKYKNFTHVDVERPGVKFAGKY